MMEWLYLGKLFLMGLAKFLLLSSGIFPWYSRSVIFSFFFGVQDIGNNLYKE